MQSHDVSQSQMLIEIRMNQKDLLEKFGSLAPILREHEFRIRTLEAGKIGDNAKLQQRMEWREYTKPFFWAAIGIALAMAAKYWKELIP